jgi:hypothetical protein
MPPLEDGPDTPLPARVGVFISTKDRLGPDQQAALVIRRHDLAEKEVERAKTRKGTADHDGSEHACKPEPHRVDH